MPKRINQFIALLLIPALVSMAFPVPLPLRRIPQSVLFTSQAVVQPAGQFPFTSQKGVQASPAVRNDKLAGRARLAQGQTSATTPLGNAALGMLPSGRLAEALNNYVVQIRAARRAHQWKKAERLLKEMRRLATSRVARDPREIALFEPMQEVIWMALKAAQETFGSGLAHLAPQKFLEVIQPLIQDAQKNPRRNFQRAHRGQGGQDVLGGMNLAKFKAGILADAEPLWERRGRDQNKGLGEGFNFVVGAMLLAGRQALQGYSGDSWMTHEDDIKKKILRGAPGAHQQWNERQWDQGGWLGMLPEDAPDDELKAMAIDQFLEAYEPDMTRRLPAAGGAAARVERWDVRGSLEAIAKLYAEPQEFLRDFQWVDETIRTWIGAEKYPTLYAVTAAVNFWFLRLFSYMEPGDERSVALPISYAVTAERPFDRTLSLELVTADDRPLRDAWELEDEKSYAKQWKLGVRPNSQDRAFMLVSHGPDGDSRLEGWAMIQEAVGLGIYFYILEIAPWNQGDQRVLKGVGSVLQGKVIETSLELGYGGSFFSNPETQEGVDMAIRSATIVIRGTRRHSSEEGKETDDHQVVAVYTPAKSQELLKRQALFGQEQALRIRDRVPRAERTADEKTMALQPPSPPQFAFETEAPSDGLQVLMQRLREVLPTEETRRDLSEETHLIPWLAILEAQGRPALRSAVAAFVRDHPSIVDPQEMIGQMMRILAPAGPHIDLSIWPRPEEEAPITDEIINAVRELAESYVVSRTQSGSLDVAKAFYSQLQSVLALIGRSGGPDLRAILDAAFNVYSYDAAWIEVVFNRILFLPYGRTFVHRDEESVAARADALYVMARDLLGRPIHIALFSRRVEQGWNEEHHLLSLNADTLRETAYGKEPGYLERLLRYVFYSSLGLAIDAPGLERNEEEGNLMGALVTPGSELETYVQENPPQDLKRALAEAAREFRSFIIVDQNLDLRVALTQLLFLAAGKHPNDARWGARFILRQLERASLEALPLSLPVQQLSARVDGAISQIGGLNAFRLVMRDRMGKNLQMPTDGSDPRAAGMPAVGPTGELKENDPMRSTWEQMAIILIDKPVILKPRGGPPAGSGWIVSILLAALGYLQALTPHTGRFLYQAA